MAETAETRRSRRRSPWLNGKLMLGIAVLVALLSLQWIGPLFVDTQEALIGSTTPNLVPVGQKANPALGFKPSKSAHPLGTDSQGRDMLAVMVVGTPRTLYVGLVAAGLGLIVGTILGFLAGFSRGLTDSTITTLTDVVLTIPPIAVLVVVAAFFTQTSVTLLALIIALFAWPTATRQIRAQVLSMREQGYVKMAQLSGASIWKVMYGEMMPNLLPYLAASFMSMMAATILVVTGLETLGLGSIRLPTLGTTINNALQASAVFRGMWWWWSPPVVVLIVIFLSLLLVTLGLDQVANPKLRKHL